MPPLIDPSVILFGYSNLKNLLTYRFLSPLKKVHPLYSLVASFLISLVNVVLYWFLTREYVRHLNLSFMKGSIDLPPFYVLFIVMDIVITLVFLVVQMIVNTIRKPGILAVYEAFRFIIFFAFFPIVVSTFWLQSFQDKFFNLKYPCFQMQLRRDVLNYYAQNKTMPSSLSEASSHRVNPFNNSPLMIKNPQKAYLFSIEDEAGNTIVSQGAFIGLDGAVGSEMLEEYKNMNNRQLENYCR